MSQATELNCHSVPMLTVVAWGTRKIFTAVKGITYASEGAV